MIIRAIAEKSSPGDRNEGFSGDPGGLWSPKEVIRGIRAEETTATAITERYSDELLASRNQRPVPPVAVRTIATTPARLGEIGPSFDHQGQVGGDLSRAVGKGKG